MLIPIHSPSRSPSPHPFTRHPHSPNIFITSPTSPSIYPSSHSRSPSRESQTHSNLNAQAILPTLAMPNSTTTGPSQISHPFQTPSSSPTASDFVPNLFSHRSGHARSQSHLGARIPKQQPSITLTLDNDGRVEKRARTESDRVKDGPEGLRTGEEMDVVPSDAGEDAKLPSPMSLTGRTSPTSVGVGVGTGRGGKVGLRSRSDSAPMWGGEGSSVQGGLSANWMGRGRSGGSFGQ